MDIKQDRTPGKPSSAATGGSRREAPAITLPKAGGALRSLDEKLSVNAVNGTCDLAVPLPFSHTRSGFDSGLKLQYSSGVGNGTFGLGWALSIPNIQRRTDKQLPVYEDATDADVFVLAGAEDLVPAYQRDGSGQWTRDSLVTATCIVQRYRPRIDSNFARIEKIQVLGEQGFFWKVTNRDNVVIIFGRDQSARLSDPDNANHVFRWLPQWMYDGLGNCVEFSYKAEDLNSAPNSVEEKNRRTGLARFTNRYLKRIQYGNITPYVPDPSNPFVPVAPQAMGYLFEAVFDYGEHNLAAPTPDETTLWPCRFDPFSDYRAGFEIRTYRLCRRVLFFHTLSELSADTSGAAQPCLVQSLEAGYQNFHFDGAPYHSHDVELLTSLRAVHYRAVAPGAYQSRAKPAMDFDYQPFQWDRTVKDVRPGDLVDAPSGASGGYQWLDLYRDGISGLVTEQAGALYYKSNLGGGRLARASPLATMPASVDVASGAWQFEDLDADGRQQLVSRNGPLQGYFELDDYDHFLPFVPFDATGPKDGSDSLLIDLDGDGRPDLLIEENMAFRWHRSLGTQGFDEARWVDKVFDEERGPVTVFTRDKREAIVLADLTGDGLKDVVRVGNGRCVYYPNLGNGRFGAKVTMRNAPLFDTQDNFNPEYLQFVDIGGTGATDVIYLGRNRFTAWINLAGNAWSEPWEIDPFPRTETPNRVSILDFLGNGTAALVWSSSLPSMTRTPMRYIDLMGGVKPYLLAGYRNNLGAQTRLSYVSSTHFALLDKSEGRPWATKLPFPVMCLAKTEVTDSVSGSRFVNEYRFRHGYYDHPEREWRGFGMVEHTDSESFDHFVQGPGSTVKDATVFQAPVRTRTWYHTGAYVGGVGILKQFAKDYWQNSAIPESPLPDAILEGVSGLPEELRQAARACKGIGLRVEVYADDDSPQKETPYSTSEHTCYVRMLQPQLTNRYAVYLALEGQSVTYHYERDPTEARVSHELNTQFDELGNVLASASVVYGRKIANPALPFAVQQMQQAIRIIYNQFRYTNDVLTNAVHRLRRPCTAQQFELTGVSPAGAIFTPTEVGAAFAGAAPIGYEQVPQPGSSQRRQLSCQRTLFASDAAPNNGLPLGALQSLGLEYQTYGLVFTPGILNALYGGKVTDAFIVEGGYVRGDDLKSAGLFPATDFAGDVWTASGTVRFDAQPESRFYLPSASVDPFGSATTIHYYSNYCLLVDRVTDALGQVTAVTAFDFRMLQPQAVLDANLNITEVRFDILGQVAGTALRGKGAEADDFNGFVVDLTQSQIDAFFANPTATAAALLGHATSRVVYDLNAVPNVSASILRETHHQATLASGQSSVLRLSFEYSDGLGHVAMTKSLAEPGIAQRCDVAPNGSFVITPVDTTPHPRWIGSGRAVLSNKGNVVMQYEPYFSVTPAYETAPQLVESGVTPVHLYDPLDRLVRTDFPDGTFSTAEFGGWSQQLSDQNDNTLASEWYQDRVGGALGLDEKSAALKAAAHDSTPTVSHVDSLGRQVFVVEHNRFQQLNHGAVVDEFYGTLTSFDILGRRLSIVDARGNTVTSVAYDLAGRAAHTSSMDAGERWSLSDVQDKPFYGWDAKDNRFRTVFDALRRPTQQESQLLIAPNTFLVYETLQYGTDPLHNQVGRLIQHRDESGVQNFPNYDFKGNSLAEARIFLTDGSQLPNWQNPSLIGLQPNSYTTGHAYDALNRVTSATTPDASVTQRAYNASGFLTSVSVAVHGGAAQDCVTGVTHDAKGQRLQIDYGNGVVTQYAYDLLTFRLRNLHTVRNSDSAVLQDLTFTYDPMGNITLIRDQAQQTVYFNGQQAVPANDYTYDALYRLREAFGREHVGQNAPLTQFDSERTHLPLKTDMSALRPYWQQYVYDQVANMVTMKHSAGVGTFTNQWTRNFSVEAKSNRLTSSDVKTDTFKFSYDVHGNITGWNGFGPMSWDIKDRFSGSVLADGSVYYTYDAQGGRTRKVRQRNNGDTEERLYLGDFELFIRRRGTEILLQRESLHVLDDRRRIALIDTEVDANHAMLNQLFRYQHSDQIDSAVLELDSAAEVVSLEQFYPFGNTSLQEVNQTKNISLKRYRFTGKERDEETGFYHYGARYYAPWIARWLSADADLADGPNRYAYVRNSPVRFKDPSGSQATDFDRPAPKSILGQVANETLGRLADAWEGATDSAAGREHRGGRREVSGLDKANAVVGTVAVGAVGIGGAILGGHLIYGAAQAVAGAYAATAAVVAPLANVVKDWAGSADLQDLAIVAGAAGVVGGYSLIHTPPSPTKSDPGSKPPAKDPKDPKTPGRKLVVELGRYGFSPVMQANIRAKYKEAELVAQLSRLPITYSRSTSARFRGKFLKQYAADAGVSVEQLKKDFRDFDVDESLSLQLGGTYDDTNQALLEWRLNVALGGAEQRALRKGGFQLGDTFSEIEPSFEGPTDKKYRNTEWYLPRGAAP